MLKFTVMIIITLKEIKLLDLDKMPVDSNRVLVVSNGVKLHLKE